MSELNLNLNRDYGFSEEDLLVRTASDAFGKLHLNLEESLRLDREEEFSPERTQAMADEGFLGMTVPSEYGGPGNSTKQYIVAVETIAGYHGSQSATLLGSNSLGVNPILKYGTKEQKKKYLPKLATGEILVAFGLTEPNKGSDAMHPDMTGKWDGDYLVLNGTKTFITNGGTSRTKAILPHFMIGKKKTVAIVEIGTKGLTSNTIKNKGVWRSSNTETHFFEDVRIHKSQILGGEEMIGKGGKIMLGTLDSGRLSVAAHALGLGHQAYRIALKYASERVQFRGELLTQKPLIAAQLADMARRIKSCRNDLYLYCDKKDRGELTTMEAAATKYDCSEMAVDVTMDAVRVLGGLGLMDDHVMRLHLDSMLTIIGEGANGILLLLMGNLIGCNVKF